jgi:hypothetical protein
MDIRMRNSATLVVTVPDELCGKLLPNFNPREKQMAEASR